MEATLPLWQLIIYTIGAGGVAGGIVAGLVRIWELKSLEKKEHKQWLREKRHETFSEVSKMITTLGRPGSLAGEQKPQSVIGEALLLINDRDLQKQLNAYLGTVQRFLHLIARNPKAVELHTKPDITPHEIANTMLAIPELDEETGRVISEGDSIIDGLRNLLSK